MSRIALYAVQPFDSPTGLCRYTATLARALHSTSNVDLSIIIGRWQYKYYTEILHIDPACLLAVGKRNTAVTRYLYMALDLMVRSWRTRWDVMHFISPYWGAALVWSRRVTTVHDLYAFSPVGGLSLLNRSVNILNSTVGIFSSDRLVTISDATSVALRSNFPSKSSNAVRIYQPATMGLLPDIKSPIDSPFLLSVAGHRKHKNLSLVIETIAHGVRAGKLSSKINLVIVGSVGTETAELRLAAGQAPFKIIFLEGISDSSLQSLYKSCEALVIASEVEGFCLPLAEGIRCGCKIVSSDIPILREVAGHYPVYFSLKGDAKENMLSSILMALEMEQPEQNVLAFDEIEYGKKFDKLYTEIFRSKI